MKISKLASIALLGGVLMAFGCSGDGDAAACGAGIALAFDCSDDGDTAGSGGDTAGSGGDTAGSGGDSGAGTGGDGDGDGGTEPPAACITPPSTMCMNGNIDPIEECCMLPAPPDVESDCDGSETVDAPASCTATENTVTHQLTQLTIAGDCSFGYDLDGCFGESCIPRGLAPGEGNGGVDNALAGLAQVLGGVGGNLGNINQAFADALCGSTDGDDMMDGCQATDTPLLDVTFVVDANTEENCANVTVMNGDTEAGSSIMNLTGACLHGPLPDLPLNVSGGEGSMGNAVLRATVSEGGFSDGALGATVDADTAVAIAEALLQGAGAVVSQVFDINADLSGDNENGCNALSGTYDVGGVVIDPAPAQ